MAAEAEVEIIPWNHTILSLQHAEAVNYVKSLPKNSFLAVEMSNYDVDVLREVLSPKRAGQYEVRYEDSTLAVLELFFECTKKNIQVIPLETFSSMQLGERASTRAKAGIKGIFNFYDEKSFRESEIREKSFARQIKLRIGKARGKLPAIVGWAHALSLAGILRNQGIKAEINTKIFSDRKMISDLMSTEAHLRNAIRSKDSRKSRFLSLKIEETSKMLRKRKGSWNDMTNSLSKGITRSWAVRAERWKRKTAARGLRRRA